MRFGIDLTKVYRGLKIRLKDYQWVVRYLVSKVGELWTLKLGGNELRKY